MTCRICDARLLEIHQTRACPDLPADLCACAYSAARKLLAARDLSDIFVPIAKTPDGLYAIRAYGKWVIVFNWTPGLGARDLALRRV